MGGGSTKKAAAGALCALALCAAPALGDDVRLVAGPPADSPSSSDAKLPAVAKRGGEAGYLVAYAVPVGPEGDADHEVHTRILGQDGRPLSEPVRVSKFGPSRNRTYEIASVALVHDDRRDRFLLAYTGMREGNERTVSARFARLLDRKGRPAGPTLRLTRDISTPYGLGEEDAAYDPVTRTFLVVFTDPVKRGAPQSRLIDAHGSLIGAHALTGPNLLAGSPAVAANRRSGRYLVAWGEEERLAAATVDPRRGPSRPHRVALRPPPRSHRGEESDDVTEPALAFDSERGELGLAWSSSDTLAQVILFQRLSGDGRRALGSPLAVSEPSSSDQFQTDPAIAFGSGDATFTIAWEDFEMSTSAPLCSEQRVHVRRVRSGGRRVGREPETLSAGSGSGFGQCGPWPTRPTVAPGPFGRGFAALWALSPEIHGTVR